MNVTGQSLVAGKWNGQPGQNTFSPYYPAQGKHANTQVFSATPEQVEAAAVEAAFAFKSYRRLSDEKRAEFLEEIANQIMALDTLLIETTHKETALPHGRLENERGRTVNQLRHFADHLRTRKGSETETGDPDRQPLPKPTTELAKLPLGPVAVFGASNFPYAFSTAGGDTASALAAGCPVIVKGHPAHPITSELTARAILQAMEICNIPRGTFSLIQGHEPAISHQLVAHSAVKAVGFTGSHAVAMSLLNTVKNREEFIPLYGELGSVNPQLILPGQSDQQQGELAQTLCQSLLTGNGQLCTSPGIWLIPEQASNLISEAKSIIQKSPSDTLLTPNIHEGYQSATDALALNEKLVNLAQGKLENAHHVQARLFKTDCETFLANGQLQQEIFGPCALMVTYRNIDELLSAIETLKGQLSASVYGEPEKIAQHSNIIESLSYKVGRMAFNQPPTGVEVCKTMNHGGPYPASTDVRHTSVGTAAIDRFERPICYQNKPQSTHL